MSLLAGAKLTDILYFLTEFATCHIVNIDYCQVNAW